MISPETRRWSALIALAFSVLVVGLDLTVLTLALPKVTVALHASTGDLQWFLDSYSLVLAAALLPAGLLGDRYGRKKLLIGGLILFGISSAACAYSTSSGELIAARAVLGLGAAVILPLAIAVIPVLFTPAERQKAIAVVMGATFIGFPVGPLLGGWLLDNFWWGSVFLINVPVVLLALLAVALLMPESRSEHRPRVDLVGVLLSGLGLTGVTYGIIKAGENGWSDAVALVTMLAGAAVLAAFVAWERRVSGRAQAQQVAVAGPAGQPQEEPGGSRSAPVRQPLVDLGLFRSAGFTWGTILATLVSFALFGILFAMPQYFQDVRGLDPSGSGVRMLPIIGGMVVGMLAGTRLASARKDPAGQVAAPLVGAKALVTFGFAVMAAGLVTGAFTRTSSGSGFAATWFAVAGLGLGLAMPAAMNAALGALSAERSGVGSALITAMRQVGATLGAAVLGSLLSTAYRGRLDVTGLPAAAAAAARSSVGGGLVVSRALRSVSLLDSVRLAFVHGMDVMLWACAGIALASALLAVAFLPRRGAAAGDAGVPADGSAAAATAAGAAEADTAAEPEVERAERGA
jgi:MFS transporter, DHA2 family, multidrug resistance protein